MTNLDYGLTVDGSKILPATNYKVVIDASNATPLQVTGGASVSGAFTAASAAMSGLTNATTLKIGGGDTINSIITYTSANTNIAAINIAASTFAAVNTTVTGVVNTDMILGVRLDNASQVAENIQVLGAFVSAANTVRVQIYAAANTNALTGKTFAVVIKR